MSIRKILVTLLLLNITSLFSCKNIKNKTGLPYHKMNDFVRDIPVTPKIKYDYSHHLVQENLQKAGLINLENGFDSICIRFWYIYNSGPFWQIVEVKKKRIDWELEQTTIKWKYNYSDSTLSFKTTKENKTPKSGWDYFIRNLLDNRVTTLPTRWRICNYEGAMDADFIIVEIATREYYRIYDYGALTLNKHIKEAVLMDNIMELLKNEIAVQKFAF